MKMRAGTEACLQSLIHRGQRGVEEPVRAGAVRGHKVAAECVASALCTSAPCQAQTPFLWSPAGH